MSDQAGLLRVLVADDDEILRETIVDVLVDDGRFEVVAAVGDAEAAIEAAVHERPPVALVDVRMPGGGGPRVARELRAAVPATRVVALSSHDDRDAIVEMFRSGAVSYLVKGEATNAEIARTLADVAAGQFTLPATVGRQVLDELSTLLEHAHQQEGHRRGVEARVRRVLASGDIEMVYQPIFGLGDAAVAGVEALARFHQEPHQGPDRWFADATAVGLAAELELMAARKALAEALASPAATWVAVNISPVTAMDPAFHAAVLADQPERIVMEITEHAIIDDHDQFQRSIEPLRRAGVRLAIDDAGAGYASLRHIVALAPDIIKLDVSLTRGIDEDPRRRAMARALISFAAELGTTIVAEGIETRAEFDTLCQLGVGTASGYLLARPGPLDEVPTTWDLPPA